MGAKSRLSRIDLRFNAQGELRTGAKRMRLKPLISTAEEMCAMKFRRGCELLLASALLVVLSGCRGHDSRPGEGFVSGHTDPSGEVTINKMGGGIDVANAPQGA